MTKEKSKFYDKAFQRGRSSMELCILILLLQDS